MRSSIRIPEIYLAFEDRGDYYMVMVSIDIDHDHVATDEQRGWAISEIVMVQPPPDAAPGPIRSGLITHRIFDYNCQSLLVYRSVSALEKHINRVSVHH